MEIEVLRRIGLSQAETKVYLSLLASSGKTVAQVAQDTGVHRTNIYSIIDRLAHMGLVAEYAASKRKKYVGASPQNLLTYVRESERALSALLPQLEELQVQQTEISVQVYQGSLGMQTAFSEMIRVGKPVYGFGIAGQLRKHLPIYAKQWIRQMEERKIRHHYVYAQGTAFAHPLWRNRVVPKEYVTPVATQIFGEFVLISIWEPALVAIIIQSKEVAEAYRKHFTLLWSIGKTVE